MATYNAGIVTAYGAAKQGGYTGTYEQFCAQQANYANTVAAVEATAAHCDEVADHCDEVLESIPQDYTNLNNEVTELKSELREYEDIFTGDVDESVQNWLDAHPEATTTVEDHSLTYKKLVIGTLGYVTPEMYGAKGDGETDDSVAVQAAIDSGKDVLFFGKYTFKNIVISDKSNISLTFADGSVLIPIHNITNSKQSTYHSLFEFYDSNNINIVGISIKSDYDDSLTDAWSNATGTNAGTGIDITSNDHNHLLFFDGCNQINICKGEISNVYMNTMVDYATKYFDGLTSIHGFQCIAFNDCENIEIANVYCHENLIEGIFTIFNSRNISVHNNNIAVSYGHTPLCFEYNDNGNVYNNRIECLNKTIGNSGIDVHSDNFIVYNNEIINMSIECGNESALYVEGAGVAYEEYGDYTIKSFSAYGNTLINCAIDIPVPGSTMAATNPKGMIVVKNAVINNNHFAFDVSKVSSALDNNYFCFIYSSAEQSNGALGSLLIENNVFQLLGDASTVGYKIRLVSYLGGDLNYAKALGVEINNNTLDFCNYVWGENEEIIKIAGSIKKVSLTNNNIDTGFYSSNSYNVFIGALRTTDKIDKLLITNNYYGIMIIQRTYINNVVFKNNHSGGDVVVKSKRVFVPSLPKQDFLCDGLGDSITWVGQNRFDGDTQQGTYDTADGETIININIVWNSSPNYMPCVPSEELSFRNNNNLIGCRFFFYDVDKTYISSIYGAPVVVPSNAAYFRIGGNKNDGLDLSSATAVVQSHSLTDYSAYANGECSNCMTAPDRTVIFANDTSEIVVRIPNIQIESYGYSIL